MRLIVCFPVQFPVSALREYMCFFPPSASSLCLSLLPTLIIRGKRATRKQQRHWGQLSFTGACTDWWWDTGLIHSTHTCTRTRAQSNIMMVNVGNSFYRLSLCYAVVIETRWRWIVELQQLTGRLLPVASSQLSTAKFRGIKLQAKYQEILNFRWIKSVNIMDAHNYWISMDSKIFVSFCGQNIKNVRYAIFLFFYPVFVHASSTRLGPFARQSTALSGTTQLLLKQHLLSKLHRLLFTCRI